MIFRFIIIIVILEFTTFLFAQPSERFVLEGFVYDDETEQPLQGANVFLNGTTFGSATDSAGYFKITGIPPGNYTLIASIIGYESSRRELLIVKPIDKSFEFNLKPTVYELEQVDVIGEEDDTWQEQFNLFKKYFIGTSQNSNECKILNPQIINFRYDRKSKELIADAKGWIKIENNALGYKVFFKLIEFNLTRRGETFYKGEVQFKELEPESEDQREEWEEEREKTFKGSLKHFLLSLSLDRLFNEGFLVYESDYPRWSELSGGGLVRPDLEARLDSISTWERGLYLEKYIRVVYLNESEDPGYFQYRKETGSHTNAILNSQTSWFKLPHGYMTFDIYGNVIDQRSSIRLYGYWGWQRIADLVPLNYIP